MKIAHFPCQPHCFTYGGFDIQMNRVIDLLNVKDLNSTRINLWERSCDFEIAHFWGATESHNHTMSFCKERDIKIVLSALFPPKSKKEEIVQFIKSKLLKTLKITRSYNLADAIIVINEDQARFAHKILGIERDKIHLIPTMLDDAFFNVESKPSVNNSQLNNFCICVGTICKRKNQIALMLAAKKKNHQVVLVGSIDNSNPSYSKDFLNLIQENPKLFRHFTSIGASELKSLYQNCSCVACVSFVETEPASILEAMIFNKPLIVANRPFSKNPVFKGVSLCDPENVDSISNSLEGIKSLNKFNYPNFNSEAYKASNVISTYNILYSKLLSAFT